MWGAPEVLATLGGSVQADISPPQLLADGRGRAAVSWQQLRVGSGASQGFVATSTGGRSYTSMRTTAESTSGRGQNAPAPSRRAMRGCP